MNKGSMVGYAFFIAIMIVVVYFLSYYGGDISLKLNKTFGQKEEVAKPTAPEMKLDSAYWGKKGHPATQEEYCTDTAKNMGYNYTIDGTSSQDINTFKECFIMKDDLKQPSDVSEMHDKFISLTAIAEPDRESLVKFCCENYVQEVYCSIATKLPTCG